MAVAILDEMQVLDQQVAPARRVAEQDAHFVSRYRIDLAALRGAARAAVAPGAVAGTGRFHGRVHLQTFSLRCFGISLISLLGNNPPITINRLRNPINRC
jgi:hypothetical protein